MRRPASVAILVLTAAVLVGCASPAGPDPSTPSSKPDVPAATVTPEPSATADQSAPVDPADPADPSTWLISDTGIGPIELGMPYSDALGLMPPGTENDPERCAWLAWWTAPAEDYNVYTAGSSDTPGAGTVVLVATEAPAGSAVAPGPRTAEGVGVGSTVAEVQEAYPSAVETADSTDPSIVHLRAGRIFFTYREDPVIRAVTVTTAEVPPYELCG